MTPETVGDEVLSMVNKEPLAKDMTLRDWFAGMALAYVVKEGIKNRFMDPSNFVPYCWDFADAMMAEREKRRK